MTEALSSLYPTNQIGSDGFNWWIGQIESVRADDKKGGGRYKVRIMGVHYQDDETIPSDQLPWDNVMYPITAGSGAANAFQTPQIRQGNFVFGFFMDGPDQQVPVIMGILGNNPQTPLSTSVGTSEDNFSAVSGYAISKDPAKLQGRAWPGDDDLTIEKPKNPLQQKESAELPPGIELNKYGLRADRPLSSQQQKDAQSAKAAGEAEGLSGLELDDRIVLSVDRTGVKDGAKVAIEKSDEEKESEKPPSVTEE